MISRCFLIASALICATAACRPAEQTPPDQSPPDREAKDAPVLPIAEPPLDRRGLLLAVADAASAAALGEDDRERQRALQGKRFALRLRFGCGPSSDTIATERRRWTFDETSRVLRFHIEPDVDSTTPLVAAIAPATFEAVEGFWLRQPWLLSAGCPVAPQAIAPEPSASPEPSDETVEPAPRQAEPRIAIAQFYTAAEPRTHRRDSRAYQATKTLGQDETPSTAGYDLVLSGRLKALPGGRVIACTPSEGDAAPRCIVSASFDQVSIEKSGGSEIVAQWATG